MKPTYNTMPLVTCPDCGQEFQVDDYYDMQRGATIDCSSCEIPLIVLSVDTIMQCEIGVKPSVGVEVK